MKEEESKTFQESTKATTTTSEPAKHRQTTSANYEYIIPEARKMIKQGSYKKAFRMLDEYFTNSKKLGTVTRIKMCRRIFATIVSISSRTMSKGEIQNPEKFVKLMEVGNYYLEQWHKNLLNFCIRTNKKFSNLQGLLDELSASSDDEARSVSRKNSRLSKTNSPAQVRTQSVRNDRQSVLLVQIKNQDPKESIDNPIETSFTEGDPTGQVEELSIGDLNINFHLDEFINYYLLHLMNWGLFHKKLKNWNMSYRYFELCLQSTRKLEYSVSPNVLYICARVRIPLVSMYMEYERYKDAQEILEGIISILQIEFTLRFNRNDELKDQINFIPRIRKTAKLMAIAFLLSGKNFELLDNYPKIIESYKLAYWFCKRFIPSDDELFKIVQKSYFKSKEDYGKHLEEIGEMERIVFENKTTKLKKNETQNPESDRFNNFEKFQELLYKKFNNASLNKMCIPISLSQKSLHEKLDEHVNATLDGTISKAHIHSASTQFDVKTQTIGDNTANSNLRLGKTQNKRKKNEAKRFSVNGQTWTQIPSDKWKLADKKEYGDDVNPESRIAELQLNDEEENRFIEKLNRNIKIKRPGTASTTALTSRFSQDFTDIDSYFNRKIENKIENNGTHKEKPNDFKKIVKNYVNFIQTEDFDDKEFKFCGSMINLKRKEDLGNILYTGKYVAPATARNRDSGPEYQKEKTNIETIGYFVDTQTKVENTIQSRLNISKALTKPKPLKLQPSSNFVSPFVSPKRLLSVPSHTTIPDSPTKNVSDPYDDGETKPSEKPKLSQILLKHRNVLKLKTVATVVKENARRHTKEGQDQNNPSTQATDAGTEDVIESRFKEDTWHRINSMVKDRLTGMMEGIEKNLKNEERIKNRIKNNKPMFQEKKKKEKFLKNLDDLAGSTRLLSVKRDASKKTLDFAELVRIQGRIKAEEKRKERANRRKTIMPNKFPVSSEFDSPMVSISVSKQE